MTTLIAWQLGKLWPRRADGTFAGVYETRLYLQFTDVCNYEYLSFSLRRGLRYQHAGTGVRRSLWSWQDWKTQFIPIILRFYRGELKKPA